MSATNTAPDDSTASIFGSDGVEVPAEELFETVIQDSDEICSRCFRRKFVAVPVLVSADDRDSHDPETRTGYLGTEDSGSGTATEVFIERESTGDVDVCYPPPAGDGEMPAADRRACPRARTVCDCGAVDADASRPTLSKESAVRHARRISERLDEADVEHDPVLLLKVVRKAKSRPELTRRDEEIFAKAVAGAVGTDEVTVETAEAELNKLAEA